MNLIVVLSIEDIKVIRVENEYQILTQNGVVIIFPENAAEEFVKDVNTLKEIRQKEGTSRNESL